MTLPSATRRRLASGMIAAAALTGIGTLAAVGNSIPLANAASTDVAVAPNMYQITPAEDGDKYEPQMNRFLMVSALRHAYHSAAFDQKYADYFNATEHDRAAGDLSENQCYIAKARLATAILAVEGDEAARSIDIAQIGIDKDATTRAYDVLTAADKKMWLAIDEEDYDEYEGRPMPKELRNRTKLFGDGIGRLRDIKDKVGTDGYQNLEVDAYSIVDFGIGKDYLERSFKENNTPDFAKTLTVTPADPVNLDQYPAGSLLATGGLNKLSLELKFPGDDAEVLAPVDPVVPEGPGKPIPDAPEKPVVTPEDPDTSAPVEPEKPVATPVTTTVTLPAVTTTVTTTVVKKEPAPAPVTTTVRETLPAPAPVTTTVEKTLPAPAPVTTTVTTTVKAAPTTTVIEKPMVTTTVIKETQPIVVASPDTGGSSDFTSDSSPWRILLALITTGGILAMIGEWLRHVLATR